MPILNEELHLHLYGCISAADLWELGRDRYRQQAGRLAWYSAEYAKAYGRRPQPADYWTRDDGLELLQQDFLFTEAAPFAQFQARFNLLIALLPIAPEDTQVVRHVLTAQRAAGLRYGEYRSFIPPTLTPEAVLRYIAVQADAVAALNAESGGQFQAALAFSLQRHATTALTQFAAIQSVLQGRAERQAAVCAVDFCGVEEGHPPSAMRAALAQMHQANSASPASALAFLYHVGESFTDKSLPSAVRWVWEAQAYGAHRLGHALALGLNPDLIAESSRRESAFERLAHLRWLQSESSWLAQRGYKPDPAVFAAISQLAALPPETSVDVAFGPAERQDCRRLQDAVMADLAARGAIIEVCPTSNIRIGGLPDPGHHPLPRFLAAGLTVVVSSDDPGIFGIDLAHEEALCREHFGLDTQAVQALQDANTRYRSRILATPLAS